MISSRQLQKALRLADMQPEELVDRLPGLPPGLLDEQPGSGPLRLAVEVETQIRAVFAEAEIMILPERRNDLGVHRLPPQWRPEVGRSRRSSRQP